jgi:colanic acid/amylovoran biosynthesis protein
MKITVTNVFGPLNRGDHELFETLLRYLDKPGVNISAVARDPELCAEHFPGVSFYEQFGKYTLGGRREQVLRRAFYLLCALLSVWLRGFGSLLPKAQREGIEAIRNADLVIGCPGGFLEDSTPSLFPQLTQLLVAALMKKTIVLAPMSLGPIEAAFPKRVLKFILGRCDKIYVREVFSEKFAADLGASSIMSNDLAFLNLQPSAQLKPAKHITVTALRFSFPRAQDKQAAKALYVERLVQTLEHLSKTTGLPVKFIVQVAGDLEVIEQVKARLSVPSEIMYDATTPEAIKELFEESYCLLASRFHSAIFALSVACPVIALSYLPKTEGMLKLYNLSELNRPIDNFDPQEIAGALLELGKNRNGFTSYQQKLLQGLERVGNPFLDDIVRRLS